MSGAADTSSSLRTLRPCMVSFYFPPHYSGSAVQALNLSRHLRRFNVEPFIVAAKFGDAPVHEVIDGIHVYRLPILTNPNLQVPSFMLSLAWFLLRRRHSYDVIHAHGTLQHGIVALAGRLASKPSLLKVAMANSDIAFGRQGRLVGVLNRFMVSRFDRYIATTSAIAAEFAAQGLDTSRVREIPNGVDTDRYRPTTVEEREAIRRELGLPEGPLVTFVGIISERKNVDGILRMFQAVVSEGAPGQLLLLGPIPGGDDNSFYRSMLAFVTDHGLRDRVTFVGQVADVYRYLRVSDIFVFPSRQEGMPNAVLEAMASGLACLVSRGSGSDGIVSDGYDGMSRALEDERGFVGVLRQLLERPDLRQEIGKNARATIEDRFSLVRIAAAYRRLYEELVH
jgi:glycosyltransferase involved in cell wall biosynthesis